MKTIKIALACSLLTVSMAQAENYNQIAPCVVTAAPNNGIHCNLVNLFGDNIQQPYDSPQITYNIRCDMVTGGTSNGKNNTMTARLSAVTFIQGTSYLTSSANITVNGVNSGNGVWMFSAGATQKVEFKFMRLPGAGVISQSSLYLENAEFTSGQPNIYLANCVATEVY